MAKAQNPQRDTEIVLRFDPETGQYQVIQLVNAVEPEIGSIVDVSVLEQFDQFTIERAF